MLSNLGLPTIRETIQKPTGDENSIRGKLLQILIVKIKERNLVGILDWIFYISL